MSIQQLLFSFQGRVGRQTYWLWNLAYYAAIVLFAAAVNKLFPGIAHLVLPVFLLLVLIPDLAITAKRWHDRDKSSWWLLLNVPLVVARLAVPVGEPTQMAQPDLWQTLISLASLLCGAWILVECGFLRGSDGDNRYGRAPH
ncbi:MULTISPECIES: DUF805 domain-containing protein [Vibrio]|nr:MULTISPECIES: DUF805 domain-containing protein [Vibrio]NAW59859.1 DUF805 domain-containing protein [Vibrio sp. V36_P2S2PM302]NAX23251.1 DUF805 domain-containing protein [Vibrio sp. V39_P1S14PM300]NAX25359.1 DUF805 domain-containing protein [Vibrio sp. V38_P2S17PM301]NAX30286.1 DUF805 domain-containing protein [Vibrio sp. V37_P2S8PM304]